MDRRTKYTLDLIKNTMINLLQEKDINKIGLYLGIFAYFAQSFVNSATIPNLTVLSLFLIEIVRD